MTTTCPPNRPSTSPPGSGYTPVQQRVIDLLGRSAGDASVAPAEVAALRAELEDRLAPVAESVPDGVTVWVGKSQLHQLDSCEARWQAEQRAPFRWSVPAARGTVAHKAIEVQIHARSERAPARLVDDAMVSLSQGETSLATFLRSLSTVEDAELRQEAVGFVTSFEECFPTLRPQWRPVVEGRSLLRLAGGRIVLAGKPDLTLGRAAQGGKVVIDLKTGAVRRHHVDDLRFYALVDACRVGTPPRRVATLYLDSGVPVAEPVTLGVLEATTERIVRSVESMVQIRAGQRPASARANPSCRFCPAVDSCETGSAFVASDTVEDDDFFWPAEPAPVTIDPVTGEIGA